MEEASKSEAKSVVAENRERDYHGHFISEETPVSDAKKVLQALVPAKLTAEKTTDDNTLLDVHVGNPLRKITSLLEEIKKQKAFSFDIKGSLGIAGVIVVIAGFGVFGWVNTLVCNKGEQSFIGTMRELHTTDAAVASPVPYLDQTISWFRAITNMPSATPADTHRFVLITPALTLLHLMLPKMTLPMSGQVIATGSYDTCSQTLNVSTPEEVELYP